MTGPDSEKTPQPQDIPVSLFTRVKNKTTKLINNTDQIFSVEGQSRWFSFVFVEPIFTDYITVEATGYDDWSSIDFVCEDVFGDEFKYRVKATDGRFVIDIKHTLLSFKFKPPRKYFTRTRILNVIVKGYTSE